MQRERGLRLPCRPTRRRRWRPRTARRASGNQMVWLASIQSEGDVPAARLPLGAGYGAETVADASARGDDGLHVVVLDADGAVLAVERVDHPAHPSRPREVGARRPRGEGDGAGEVVLRVERSEGRHLRADRRGIAREPLKGQVEGVAPVVHGDAAAGVAMLAPPVGAPLGDAAVQAWCGRCAG